MQWYDFNLAICQQRMYPRSKKKLGVQTLTSRPWDTETHKLRTSNPNPKKLVIANTNTSLSYVLIRPFAYLYLLFYQPAGILRANKAKLSSTKSKRNATDGGEVLRAEQTSQVRNRRRREREPLKDKLRDREMYMARS